MPAMRVEGPLELWAPPQLTNSPEANSSGSDHEAGLEGCTGDMAGGLLTALTTACSL